MLRRSYKSVYEVFNNNYYKDDCCPLCCPALMGEEREMIFVRA